MSGNLVILESPGKVKSIAKYLGKGYQVMASNGHLVDLPKKQLGIDLDNKFKPTYEVLKDSKKAKSILKKMQDLAKKVDKILIATDPDREGEAIGWHIAEKLKKYNKNIYRISFNEITKKGVLEGIKKEGEINKELVDAQQARRIMDRIVGYQVSPFLWKIVVRGLSAGRVQSVALRLICERDKEIELFKSKEYWSLKATGKHAESKKIPLVLAKIKEVPIAQGKNLSSDKYHHIATEVEAEKIYQDLLKRKYHIYNIKNNKVVQSPYPPFITSTLLQESVKQLGFSSKKTMSVAQKLYEGVEIENGELQGLITYMRTDSKRVSEDAQKQLRSYIKDNYGEKYLSKYTRNYKSKNNIQDAHEAIRPTNIDLTPDFVKNYLTKDQFKLYELIWQRFVATQMQEALFMKKVIDIISEDEVYNFRASGQTLEFNGFLSVYTARKISEDVILPQGLSVDDDINIYDILKEQHFTKPPARYNEASLTKTLEEKEIGRPSTYATIVSRLILQKYIDKEGKQLLSTELGKLINHILVENFPNIFNVQFTKEMEDSLDRIAMGEESLLRSLETFYNPFACTLEEAINKIPDIKAETIQKVGETCPDCDQGDLIYKWSKNGKFIACTNFPKCKYTRSIEGADDKVTEEDDVAKKIVGKCDKCSGDLVVKKGKYGEFVACSNYPKCKNILRTKIDVPCPECGGEIVEKVSKRRKKFYGCSNFPKCNFATWNKPVKRICPECGCEIMEDKENYKTKAHKFICIKCKHEIDES